MPIPPIPGVLGIAGATAVAGQALGAASSLFSNLLKGALPGVPSVATGHADATAKPLAGRLGRPQRAANPQAVRQELDTLLSQFQGRLKELLQGRGLALQGPIPIQTNEFGQCECNSSHPQAKEISSLLRGSSELDALFGEIAAKAGLLRAIEEADAFQQAYRENPEAAIAQYPHLFETGEDPFHQPRSKPQVTVSSEAATVEFVSVTGR